MTLVQDATACRRELMHGDAKLTNLPPTTWIGNEWATWILRPMGTPGKLTLSPSHVSVFLNPSLVLNPI